MTVGCATCHDHKFDPISQKDFYALGAFFRNTTQKVMDGNVSDTPPILLAPRAADRSAWEEKNARIAAVRREMDAARDGAGESFQQWLNTRVRQPKAQPAEGSEEAFAADLAEPMVFEKAEGRILAKSPKVDAEKPFSVSVRFRYPEKDQNYTIAGQQNA